MERQVFLWVYFGVHLHIFHPFYMQWDNECVKRLLVSLVIYSIELMVFHLKWLDMGKKRTILSFNKNGEN